MGEISTIESQLKERLGLVEIKTIAKSASTKLLFRLMHSDDSQVARNAAWAITHQSDESIKELSQPELIAMAMTSQSVSLRRLALHLILRQGISKDDMRGDFLDFCLQHMVMLEEPSGVQSLCMKLAMQMCSYYPELQHEFDETIQLMHAEHYKPGLNYLIKKIKKSRN